MHSHKHTHTHIHKHTCLYVYIRMMCFHVKSMKNKFKILESFICKINQKKPNNLTSSVAVSVAKIKRNKWANRCDTEGVYYHMNVCWLGCWLRKRICFSYECLCLWPFLNWQKFAKEPVYAYSSKSPNKTAGYFTYVCVTPTQELNHAFYSQLEDDCSDYHMEKDTPRQALILGALIQWI